jgi:endonuclease IV
MKIGLKLWSSNDFYIDLALSLFEDGIFNYIELFIEPDSLAFIDKWRSVGIPFVLHAPHSLSGLNPADADCEVRNFELIQQVDEYRKALNPKYIIFHPGINGDIKETIRQFCEIRNRFPDTHKCMLVENKPMKGLNGERCLGFAPAEIERVTHACDIGMCLDFGHAFAAANSLGIPSEIILEEFRWQEPAMYHLSDGDISAEIDGHLNLGKGSYPIADLTEQLPGNAMVTLETAKANKGNLNDFIDDAEYLGRLKNRQF